MESHDLDCYKVLGLTQDATLTDIRKAYRKLALETHPDKQADSSATAFRQVKEAYDTLSDPLKRERFDRKYEEQVRFEWNRAAERRRRQQEDEQNAAERAAERHFAAQRAAQAAAEAAAIAARNDEYVRVRMAEQHWIMQQRAESRMEQSVRSFQALHNHFAGLHRNVLFPDEMFDDDLQETVRLQSESLLFMYR